MRIEECFVVAAAPVSAAPDVAVAVVVVCVAAAVVVLVDPAFAVAVVAPHASGAVAAAVASDDDDERPASIQNQAGNRLENHPLVASSRGPMVDLVVPQAFRVQLLLQHHRPRTYCCAVEISPASISSADSIRTAVTASESNGPLSEFR